MADMWHSIDVGVKVEVENTDMDDFCEEFPNSFWIASVLRVEGINFLLTIRFTFFFFIESLFFKTIFITFFE